MHHAVGYTIRVLFILGFFFFAISKLNQGKKKAKKLFTFVFLFLKAKQKTKKRIFFQLSVLKSKQNNRQTNEQWGVFSGNVLDWKCTADKPAAHLESTLKVVAHNCDIDT